MSERFEAKLGLNTKEVDSKLRGVKDKIKNFGKSIAEMGPLMAAGIGIAIAAIGKITLDLVKLGGEITGVKTAFQNLGAPGLLQGLRLATRGTVDDLTLMKKAVQANNFKIPLSQLATYFEFATKRAIQTGESVDYLVDSIITGIGRKSVLVMDNLGISAVELQNEVAKTGDFAEAAGVIIRRELTSMGDVADTTAVKVASIGTAFKNLKAGIAVKTSESGLLQRIAGWFNNIGLAMQSDLPFAQAYAMQTGRTNITLEEQNKLLAENAAALLKQKERLAAINELNKLKSQNKPLGKAELNPLTGLPGTDIKSELAGAPDYKPFYDFTKGISEQQQALIDLSSTFAGFFSDVKLGFEGMIDGAITGLKRLVMELIAKAAFLAILSAIFPGAGVALNIGNILGGNASKLISSGGGGSTASASVGSAGNLLNDQLVAELAGNKINLMLRRS